MIQKIIPNPTPRTVDEAAQSLLSDLLTQHLQILSQMTANEFEMLCRHATPYLIDEFKIWQGNDALLDSCFACGEEEMDPARIILNRLKDMLNDINGLIVIT